MRTFRRRIEDSTFDLNLAPMLDIIVSIVPMLLLSTVFMRITVVDTTVPQVVAKAVEEDRKKTDRDVVLRLEITPSSEVKVSVKSPAQNNELKVQSNQGQMNLKELHKVMVKLKQQYPENFRLEFIPAPKMNTKDIIAVLDNVRNREKEDPQIFMKDDATGKMISLDLMFPDVVFSDVVGG